MSRISQLNKKFEAADESSLNAPYDQKLLDQVQNHFGWKVQDLVFQSKSLSDPELISMFKQFSLVPTFDEPVPQNIKDDEYQFEYSVDADGENVIQVSSWIFHDDDENYYLMLMDRGDSETEEVRTAIYYVGR
ncbi:structural protein [Yersinia phage YerA41]|nr:structural protein [Yersinia phage YerA41]